MKDVVATWLGCSDMLWSMCVTWYDVRVISGGVSRVYDVRETGVETWACSRSLESGKYGKNSKAGHRGSSRGHKEGLGVVRSCAEGPSVLLQFRTYLGARATTSMEQERFWMAWCKIKVMSMLRMSYKTGKRCWNAYLGRRELSAAAG